MMTMLIAIMNAHADLPPMQYSAKKRGTDRSPCSGMTGAFDLRGFQIFCSSPHRESQRLLAPAATPAVW
jgi:hypothetical protein